MEKSPVKSYQDLMVWQKAIALADLVYAETKKFPKEELYGLTNQIRRAVVSIPANIAEGWGRDSTKNYVQFLKISRGSLYELETMMVISFNQNYLDKQALTSCKNEINELGRMLNTLIKKLNNYAANATNN
jgi:four helix bundle protein